MRSVFFEKVHGKNIFCILSEPSDNQKKIIIMSHGFRGNSTGPARAFVDFERLLLKQGFSVLRFDQPCSGNSDGKYTDSSFNEWVETTSYFAEKYLKLDYQTALMGQSMGATTTMVVAAQKHLKDRIPCIILWVPDAKSDVNVDPNETYEEGGQRYKGNFWIEARDSDFFGALDKYPGGIHLVYGENDRYVSQEMKRKIIKKIKDKGNPCMILPGQDHSPWEFEVAQEVYEKEIKFLKEQTKLI